MLQYLVGLGVLVLGGSWAAVPLYRIFCAHTGYGGTTAQDKDGSKLAALKPGKREVVVTFNADVSPFMHWKFVPSQPRLKVRLGEPVLAFYKATNLRDKAVTGVATYNVTPLKTGTYFHKIQCFWSVEQRKKREKRHMISIGLRAAACRSPLDRPARPLTPHSPSTALVIVSLPLVSMSNVCAPTRPSTCRCSSTSTRR